MAYWSPDELESALARDATLNAQSLDVRVRVLVSVCAWLSVLLWIPWKAQLSQATPCGRCAFVYVQEMHNSKVRYRKTIQLG